MLSSIDKFRTTELLSTVPINIEGFTMRCSAYNVTVSENLLSDDIIERNRKWWYTQKG